MKLNDLKIKPKKCKQCSELFTPLRPLQMVCGAPCAIAYGNKIKARKAADEAKKAKREHKEKLDKAKTAKERKPETQRVFNIYIRTRDADKPCISCGRTNIPEQIGGAWDCGHYLSVGARPDLRFDEANAHKQCKSCNGGAGKYARKNYTVSQSYRINLIERIGLAEVERLEGPAIPKHYTADELNQLKIYYKQKTKQLLEKGNKDVQ
jgi:hypothetical protein